MASTCMCPPPPHTHMRTRAQQCGRSHLSARAQAPPQVQVDATQCKSYAPVLDRAGREDGGGTYQVLEAIDKALLAFVRGLGVSVPVRIKRKDRDACLDELREHCVQHIQIRLACHVVDPFCLGSECVLQG